MHPICHLCTKVMIYIPINNNNSYSWEYRHYIVAQAGLVLINIDVTDSHMQFLSNQFTTVNLLSQLEYDLPTFCETQKLDFRSLKFYKLKSHLSKTIFVDNSGVSQSQSR